MESEGAPEIEGLDDCVGVKESEGSTEVDGFIDGISDGESSPVRDAGKTGMLISTGGLTGGVVGPTGTIRSTGAETGPSPRPTISSQL